MKQLNILQTLISPCGGNDNICCQEILDGLEFAKGDASTTWGSVRAAMGHPAPFDLKYVAIGNEDCGKKYYRGMLFVSCIAFFFELLT